MVADLGEAHFLGGSGLAENKPPLAQTFPVPEWDQEAAQQWVELGRPRAVRSRPASQVLVLDARAAGIETWMCERQQGSALGTLAPPSQWCSTADDEHVQWFGPSARQWAGLLGLEDVTQARRTVFSAVRGLFVETGILLAGATETHMVDALGGADWSSIRSDIVAGNITFATWLRRRGWGVRTDLLRFLCHWRSPAYAFQRANTTVFAVVLPAGQGISGLPGEDRWAAWLPVGAESVAALVEGPAGPTSGSAGWDQLVVPAVQVLVEEMSQAQGLVAYMSGRRAWTQADVVLTHQEEGGTPMALGISTDARC